MEKPLKDYEDALSKSTNEEEIEKKRLQFEDDHKKSSMIGETVNKRADKCYEAKIQDKGVRQEPARSVTFPAYFTGTHWKMEAVFRPKLS
jgi:hypothetical protein